MVMLENTRRPLDTPQTGRQFTLLEGGTSVVISARDDRTYHGTICDSRGCNVALHGPTRSVKAHTMLTLHGVQRDSYGPKESVPFSSHSEQSENV